MTGRALLLAAALGARVAAAQVDTTARDTTRAGRDTIPLDTAAVLRPILPAAVPAGPLPPGTRYSFTPDSVLLSGGYTLSDVLMRIPGVYVARGGFYGQAEPVLRSGRGAVALEVFWDGVPYLPLGRDSIFLDPARIPLAPLERIDVVVLPAVLRVYLVTARHASSEPVTAVHVLTGQQVDFARYQGSFARRWRSGVGLAVLADLNALDGQGQGSSSGFTDVDLWLSAEYVPGPRFGVSYQVLSSDWTRDERAGLVDGRKSHRVDHTVRAFLARRADGFGTRLELSASAATVAEDTALGHRSGWQAGVAWRHVARRSHAGLTVWAADERRPFEVEATGSWIPRRGLSLVAGARHSTYAGSRSGARVHGGAGLELPLGFSAHGDVVWNRQPAAPFVPGGDPQETTDLAAALHWRSRWARVELGGGRRDPFTPLGAPAGLKPIGSLGPSFATRYVSAFATVTPPFLGGLGLSGWYVDPEESLASDFEPPHHARVSAVFLSKFWRTFPSGIFTLRGEVAVESWSEGRGGRDSVGTPLVLPGRTFLDTNFEIRIGDATVVWVIRNARATRGGYAPRLGYPSAVQYFGVRWTFSG
ncbi:MAG: TonB-dependent receptor [Gemmatimonadales bacterium]